MDDDDNEDDEFIPRLRRIVLPRINFNLHSSIFRQSFRVDMEVANQLELLIGRYLQNTNMNNALTPRQQILTALHFLGNNAQYHVNGQVHGISKSTVFRYIHRVCYLISYHLLPLFVRWPSVSLMVERRFFFIAGFPHIRGVVDGTLVHIDAPSFDEPAYVGRDNKHSINVILVGGPQNEFFFVSAKFPGSIHDARAIRNTNLWQLWEIEGWRPDNDHQSIILGDSAYPLTSWLIPPVVRNVNANIRRLARGVPLFETTHRKTRFVIECSIGILKEEFPCLNYFRIRNPIRIARAIYTCVTLHNMQNIHHRGSYVYDAVLNRIAHEPPPNDNNTIDNQLQNDEEEMNGVIRQRQIL